MTAPELYLGSGHLTGADIIAAKRELLADEERVRRLTFGIVSLVDVTDFQITLDDVRELAGIDQELALLAPRAAVAVVAPRDHDFGMARMWQAVAQVPGWSTGVFRTRPEADAWLQEIPHSGGSDP